MEYKNSIVRIQSDTVKYNWFCPDLKEPGSASTGSGFIIDNKNYYILTNAHVVANSTEIYISIPQFGQNKFTAKLISTFPYLDLALLQINDIKEFNEKLKSTKVNIKIMEFGDSFKIKSEDKVRAIGYPLGSQTLKTTSGTINGFEDGNIQIDAPINPGNSGGPLINEKNQIIGINSSKNTSNDSDNVGYAIPINIIKIHLDNMKKIKLIHHIEFNMRSNNISSNFNKSIGYNKKQGVYIQEISPNSILKNLAQEGDLLLKINNMEIDNYGDVKFHNQICNYREILKYIKMNEEFKITIFNSKLKKIQDKKVKYTDKHLDNFRKRYFQHDKIEYINILGITIMQLYINHAQIILRGITKSKELPVGGFESFKLASFCHELKNTNKKKYFVSFISSNSLIEVVENIRKGDFINKINGKEIKSIDDIKKELDMVIKKKSKLFIETAQGMFYLEYNEIIKEEEKMEKAGLKSYILNNIKK